MTSVTTGLVVLGPLNSTNQTKRFDLVCSVDARWDKAQHTMTESPTASLGNVGIPIYSANRSGQRSTTGIQRAALPIDHGNWTNISADAAWLDALTPSLPKVQGPKVSSPASNMITAFAKVILAGNYKLTTSSTADYTVEAIESIISTAFTDAVSRVGLYRLFGPSVFFANSGTKYYGPGFKLCPLPPQSVVHTPLTFQGYLKGEISCTDF